MLSHCLRSLLFLVIASPVFGQASTAPSPTPDRTQRDLVTLPTVATVAAPGVSLSLDATTDDKKGSVAAAFANADDTLTFSVTASGPLSEDTGEAQPLTLRGLPSSASAEFALNWFNWPGAPDPVRSREFCMERLHKPECDDSDFQGQDREEFLAINFADRNPWIVSVSAALGRTEFKYVNRSDLQEAKEAHNDGELGFTVGQYAPLRGYVALGYTYQRAWEAAGAPSQICSPLENSVSGATECRSVVVGAPTHNVNHRANLQWRRFFAHGRAAINPTLVRDFSDGVTELAMPVYFFSNENGGLSGGARLVWRSDTEALTFALFVGTALPLFD